jgi:hypothetical protein
MQATHQPDPSAAASSAPSLLREAFHDLHGARLHGFALLLTLGDRRRAAGLASGALSAASADLATLRHPERAAAWLRAHVVRHAGRRVPDLPVADRIAGLADLEVSSAALAGLAALDVRGRAAVIATHVERLDRRDVATVVGQDGQRLERLVQRSIERYLAGHGAVTGDTPPSGPIAERVRAASARVMA